MVWRKHYRSMYEGSMIGSGAVVFALMGYVIAHQEFDRKIGKWTVRLNPILLSAILGETPEVIKLAIEHLVSEDQNSGTPDEGGRRLIGLGEGTMGYWVVNGEKYQEMRNCEDRREQNRLAQEKFREKSRKAMSGEGVDNADKPRQTGRPAVEEIKLECAKIGLPESEGEKMFTYYESNGWKVGRNPMKSWKAALVNWKRNYDERRYESNGAAGRKIDGRTTTRPTLTTKPVNGF